VFAGVAASDEILALDEAAWKLVAVQNRSVERQADGRMSVRVELANLSAMDLSVQVSTLFRDAQGMPSSSGTPFEMIVIPGNGSQLYEVTSLERNPESFTVQIKTP